MSTSEPILSALQQHFGHSRFRPGQQAVIEHLMAGRSAAAVFPMLTAVDSRTNPASTAGTAQHDLDLVSG